MIGSGSPSSTEDAIALDMDGTGTLTLGGSNTYSDGTTIDDGAIQISSQSALGSGPLEDDSSLIFDYDDIAGIVGTSFYTSITGSGDFTKSGTGEVTLFGANSYLGTTTITAGTLSIGALGGTIGRLDRARFSTMGPWYSLAKIRSL